MTADPEYLCITPGNPLTDILCCSPFRAVMIVDREASPEWRETVASWLIEAGCRYAMTWGIENEKWHDDIDWTILERFGFGDIPDNSFIMTTWHKNLDETFWFAQFCALTTYDDIELGDTLLVHVSDAPARDEILKRFEAATECEG